MAVPLKEKRRSKRRPRSIAISQKDIAIKVTLVGSIASLKDKTATGSLTIRNGNNFRKEKTKKLSNRFVCFYRLTENRKPIRQLKRIIQKEDQRGLIWHKR